MRLALGSCDVTGELDVRVAGGDLGKLDVERAREERSVLELLTRVVVHRRQALFGASAAETGNAVDVQLNAAMQLTLEVYCAQTFVVLARDRTVNFALRSEEWRVRERRSAGSFSPPHHGGQSALHRHETAAREKHRIDLHRC